MRIRHAVAFVLAALLGCGGKQEMAATGGGGNGGSATPGTAGTGSPSGAAGTGSPSGSAGTTGHAGSGPAGSGGYAGSVAGTTGAGGSGAGGTTPAGTLMGDVSFSVPSQSFKGQLMVGMTTTISGAEIRYTTDGTLPTASSMLYGGTALALTGTTQLRAMPFVSGSAAGLVSTAIYIARTFDLTSKLPIMILDGYGKGLSTNKTTYLNAAVMIWEPVNGTATLTALPTIATRAAYHLRGQSSASFPQKPYKVEFRDNADADAKYPVLGMPADADWALIAPYYDRALIRNPFVYTLGKEMGMEVPRTAFVEVYLNGAAKAVADTDYQGIYWLSETIKNNKNRINLKELDVADTTAPGVTGGYIFKFDQAATDAAAPHINCTTSTGVTCWKDCELVDPDPVPAPEQLAWITQYVQSFHNTLFTTPIGNYAQYIDVPSFVDDLIINELTRNVDAYVRSSYYHKDRDGLLKGGPLWDYNFSLAVGGMNTISPISTTNDGGWQFQGRTAGSLPSRNVNSWFPKLMADPAFVDKVKARWKSLRTGLYSNAQLEARMNMLTAQLDPAAVARDFAKWPVSTVYPTSTGFVRGPAGATWEEQVKAMHDYVIARVAWMDTQWQ